MFKQTFIRFAKKQLHRRPIIWRCDNIISFFGEKTRIILKTITGLFIVMALSQNTSAGDGSWGLSFPNPGEAPTGSESKDYLQKFDSYFVGNESEKVIYLTFDAGYESGYTATILDVLKKYDAPATFFLVGTYIKSNPELVNRMISEGHVVGNHTMNHPNMTQLSEKAAFSDQLNKTADIYKSVTGSEMKKFYRPPEGKYSEENLKMANDLGYKTIFWSIAYMDYDDKNQPTKEMAFSKLTPRIHPGAVLLLHNTSKTNSLILDELLQRYVELGYEFRSLEDFTV